MRTRVLRRPIVFLRFRFSSLILFIKLFVVASFVVASFVVASFVVASFVVAYPTVKCVVLETHVE